MLASPSRIKILPGPDRRPCDTAELTVHCLSRAGNTFDPDPDPFGAASGALDYLLGVTIAAY
jgi:hypothetical protein